MASRLIAHGSPTTEYFTFDSLTALGVPNATTTKHCPGISSFAEPIVPESPKPPFRAEAERVLGAAGLEMARVSYARQVHGSEAARAPAGGGFAGLVDIVVTAERRVPLAIFTADCLAIVLCDPASHALAVAHVGWRGTVKGATRRAVQAVTEVGARRGSLRVAIAPSIGPCCYEVDEPVTAEFARAFGDRWRAWVRPSRAGRVMLDLWSANEALLADAGVEPASIENPRLCTACHPDLLYSYRRGNRGRLVTLAALP
jgi:YfiH family protein